MLDLKTIKNNISEVASRLKQKGVVFDVVQFKQLETSRKDLQITVEKLQSERNSSAKAIGVAKAAKQDIQPLLAKVSDLKQQLSTLVAKLLAVQAQLNTIMSGLPNLPLADVPIGSDENDNVELRKVGTIPKFDFVVKDHVELGVNLDNGLDFATAGKISGSRFVVMRGKIAKLHRVLTQFMLEVHIEQHGFDEVYVPYLVNQASLFGTGQLPKFKADLFNLNVIDTQTKNAQEMFLIPTAEVPVTNIYRDTIINQKQLPIKHICHTPCFRSEAGSYGRDTKGLIRQHQFEKVEMVMLVEPNKSVAALEQLTKYAENILQQLNLPYRVISLCTGDLGFSAAKTYDLEVWLPSQNTYREISSCSNFMDFQARRMQARYRVSGADKPKLLHTLNGSGLAVGRALVAIIENYQNQDGSINIPEVLQPLMNGLQQI